MQPSKPVGHWDAVPNLWAEPAVDGDAERRTFHPRKRAPFTAGFAIALHMHQPLIPARGGELRKALIASNLEIMARSSRSEDSYNARVFLDCYRRMGRIIPSLVEEGKAPRVMLDYSGCLLHGLCLAGQDEVLVELRTLTEDERLVRCVEWLGTAWGHAVAPSTPALDFRLHIEAWQRQFGGLFGREALRRVRGFSLPEMALPNHPDAAYLLLACLEDLGFEWVIVQEHTVETLSGDAVHNPHVPHRLMARSSNGEERSIAAFVKTQGSDTKLVAQLQPYFEAKTLEPVELAGTSVPPLVVQIADGENGGVMMNEFPSKFVDVMREASGTQTPPLTISEYWDHLRALGITKDDLPGIQPRGQHRLWACVPEDAGPEIAAKVLDALRRDDPGFLAEGASWSGDRTWSRGYEHVLDPMLDASARFHERLGRGSQRPDDARSQRALYHLLLSQTSCFRYWGEGAWTDFGRELCRRVLDDLEHP